jgi:rSAM/selenodomain-associated transferase 2
MRGECFREPIHALSLHDVIILTKPEPPNAEKESTNIRSKPISIIVPVLNEAASIERFLRCLRERAGDAEVIVVDGGSSDGTVDLARNHCDRCLHAPRGRAVQMNAAAHIASGDTFWFMHADCEVPAGCLEEISDALRRPEVVGGFFRVRIPNRRFVYRLTDSFAHYAGLLLRMRFGDHGFFCRRTAFEEIGGFPEVPLMEDAEFFRKLRRLGGIAIISSRLISSPRRYEEIGPWRLSFTYGLIALLYLLRVPIPVLAAIYRTTCALAKQNESPASS